MSSVHIALAFSGHLNVIMVDLDHVRKRLLFRDQLDCKNARVPQTNDRKGRSQVGRRDR